MQLELYSFIVNIQLYSYFIVLSHCRSMPAPTAPAVQQYFSLDFDTIEKTGSSSSSKEIPSLATNDDVDDLLKEPTPTLPTRTTGR